MTTVVKYVLSSDLTAVLRVKIRKRTHVTAQDIGKKLLTKHNNAVQYGGDQGLVHLCDKKRRDYTQILPSTYVYDNPDKVLVLVVQLPYAVTYQMAGYYSRSLELTNGHWLYNPAQALCLKTMEPQLPSYERLGVSTCRPWRIVRYWLEYNYGLHQKVLSKPNDSIEYFEAYRVTGDALAVSGVPVDDDELIRPGDRLVLRRKPSQSHCRFMPHKPIDFYDSELIYGSEDAAMEAYATGAASRTGGWAAVHLRAKVHPSAFGTHRMPTPSDYYECYACGMAPSDHYASFCASKDHGATTDGPKYVEDLDDQGLYDVCVRSMRSMQAGVPKAFLRKIGTSVQEVLQYIRAKQFTLCPAVYTDGAQFYIEKKQAIASQVVAAPQIKTQLRRTAPQRNCPVSLLFDDAVCASGSVAQYVIGSLTVVDYMAQLLAALNNKCARFRIAFTTGIQRNLSDCLEVFHCAQSHCRAGDFIAWICQDGSAVCDTIWTYNAAVWFYNVLVIGCSGGIQDISGAMVDFEWSLAKAIRKGLRHTCQPPYSDDGVSVPLAARSARG